MRPGRAPARSTTERAGSNYLEVDDLTRIARAHDTPRGTFRVRWRRPEWPEEVAWRERWYVHEARMAFDRRSRSGRLVVELAGWRVVAEAGR